MTTYAWQPVTQLQTNGIYRFVALVPPTWTADQTEAYLDPTFGGKVGWDVKSISVPPANVQAALDAAHVVFPSGQTPAAFWVTAAWPGGPGALATDPNVTVEQLAQYTPVPPGTPGSSPDPVPEAPPPPASKNAGLYIALGLGAAAVLGWLYVGEVRKLRALEGHHRGYAHNPLQTIAVNVNGRRVPFVIESNGIDWKALADVKVGRKKTLIVGKGATKSDALQQAIQMTSSVFAQADLH